MKLSLKLWHVVGKKNRSKFKKKIKITDLKFKFHLICLRGNTLIAVSCVFECVCVIFNKKSFQR